MGKSGITERRLIPPLSALVAFESAARHASFTRAAAELCLTQGAISRSVGQLENTVGVKLFNRAGNNIFLTEAGGFYLEKVGEALRNLAEATRETSMFLGRRGLLRLKIPPTFAIRWLIPRIGAFLEQHPEIEVVFSAYQPGTDDLVRGETDAFIYYGSIDLTDLSRYKLLDDRWIIVAHPDLSIDLLAPRSLCTAALLVQQTRPQLWQTWFDAQGLVRDPNQPLQCFSQFNMVVEAASNKLGVALMPEMLVTEELSNGRLVELFKGSPSLSDGLYLAHAIDRSDYPPVQKFRDWIVAKCQSEAG